MNTLLRITLCLISPITAFSQANLVVNGSFEDHNDCPTGISAVAMDGMAEQYLVDWIAPTWGTSDYFHGCSHYSASVPANFSGYQSAKDGEAYAGIFLMVTDDTLHNTYLYREYLLGHLKKPLEAGKHYCVSFWASPTDNANAIPEKYAFASRPLGAYLSKDPTADYQLDLTAPTLPFQPQINATTVMADTTQWYPVSGMYTAAGGEEWITIGNFQSNTQTRPLVLIRKGLPDAEKKYSVYYYIDKVSVVETDRPFLLPFDRVLCPSDWPFSIVPEVPLTDFHWSTGETSPTITVREPGAYILEARFEGCALNDTIRLDKNEPPPVSLGPDIDNCLDGQLQMVTLKNETQLENYSWSTGAHEPEINVSEKGDYWLSTFTGCRYVSDTIHIAGCEPFVYVPNVFSPDIAGANARFIAFGQNVALERLSVFNQWGIMVYDEYPVKEGWDGRFKGEKCMPGVYVWSLRYRPIGAVETQEKHGDMTLVR